MQGVTLELNAKIVASAFGFPRDLVGTKDQTLSDVAITKYLGETTIEFLERKKKKQGTTCIKILQGRVYRFIAEAISLKGTNTYISEGLFGQCLGKATLGHSLDMAREIANAIVKEMQNVKLKALKLVKCAHVWVGLFRQAIGQCQVPTNPLLDASSLSNPSKQAPEAAQLKKRMLEKAL